MSTNHDQQDTPDTSTHETTKEGGQHDPGPGFLFTTHFRQETGQGEAGPVLGEVVHLRPVVAEPAAPAGPGDVPEPRRPEAVQPRPDTALEPKVFDAELVDDTPETGTGPVVRRGLLDLLRVHSARDVVGGEAAGRVVGRAAVRAVWWCARRHGTFIVRGAEAERQRKRAERNQADARAARARALEGGDLEKVAELNRQIQQARHTRVDVWLKWVELGWSAVRKLALALVIALGVAVVLGLFNGFGGWFGPWGVSDVLYTLGAILTTTGSVIAWCVYHVWLFVLAGLGVWLFHRWKDGIRLGEQVLPENLRRDGTRTAYVELNENTLVAALANIGNTKLATAIKDGWPNRDTDNAWVRFPMIDGKGYSAKLRLPMGASVAKVNQAKDLLAHNLGCRPQELFIESDPDDPTVMDLFRLEPGVLREPVPPYPLLTEGTTDYWTGFPVGIAPRGDVVTTPVFERNFVFSGAMGSGKTTMVLDLVGGAVLDPLVDIDVFVFADNADYDPLAPVLSTFRKGDSPDNVAACIDHIQNLHADLSARGKLLEKHGQRSVTRELAAKEPVLRPRLVVVDECQSFFRQGKPDDRRNLIDAVVRFYSAARKYAINLVFITPVPSDASLPRDLVAVTSNKACGAIGDKLRNNVVLGEKAHENGISALGLKPKTKDKLNDAGTLVTVGFMDTPGIVRSFYLTPSDLAQIAARGIELRGGPTSTAPAALQPRRQVDHLADINTVLARHHDTLVPVHEVLNLLGQHDATTYSAWTPADLRAALPQQAKPYKTRNGSMHLNADRVATALADRDTDPDTESDTDSDDD